MRVSKVFACCLVSCIHSAVADPLSKEDSDVFRELDRRGLGTALFQSASGVNNTACASACQVLKEKFPSSVLSRNASAYTSWQKNFWSAQQGSVDPYCIFQPADNKAVSSAVLLSRATMCPFAVKSGGHAAFAGASNIDGGITIDLVNFKQLSVSEDKTVVEIGPGNRWYDVYVGLEPHNLTVVGGRVFDVGVGGLTLGGGISFFSNLYGWACDNVISYELVDANGQVLDVTYDAYPDLYWALRGGGNNFGVVTKFTVNAYPLGQMWGGPVLSLGTEVSGISDAWHHFATHSSDDPKAAYTLVYANSNGTWIYASYIEYAEPVPSGTHPSIFDNLFAVPSLADQTGNKSLANITVEMGGGSGSDALTGNRETYWTATFKVDEQLLPRFSDTFTKHVQPILGVKGLLPIVAFQPITEGILTNMQRKGGNALGLDPEEGPFFILNWSFMWSDPADDDAIFRVAQEFYDDVVAQGKELGLHMDYIYMNYASQYVDVISSYGEENHRKLKDISRKYDPNQVFQNLQPGYFKL